MQTYDLQDADVRELNQALHLDSADKAEFQVTNPNGKHSVAVGAMFASQIEIDGHVGYYCAGMNQHANITVNGNAGSGCAENMMSGTVRVKGNASQYCAATAHGGMVVIEGDTAARCGISMKGVDIVVGGSVGNMSAFMAQSGRMVICGDAGDALGDSLYEARIYVGGEVQSLGADCIEKPMQAEHQQELQQLLTAAGMDDVDASKFRRYGSARKLYNFNIDHAGEY
jgi:methylamine---glutamate N-methyltransferase subunit B